MEFHLEKQSIKMNCWEFKNCGREAEICPAATELSANGINDGKNGGRTCWVIAGTLCGGRVQGVHAEKISDCMECDFYLLVKKEEGNGFDTAIELAMRVLYGK